MLGWAWQKENVFLLVEGEFRLTDEKLPAALHDYAALRRVGGPLRLSQPIKAQSRSRCVFLALADVHGHLGLKLLVEVVHRTHQLGQTLDPSLLVPALSNHACHNLSKAVVHATYFCRSQFRFESVKRRWCSFGRSTG